MRLTKDICSTVLKEQAHRTEGANRIGRGNAHKWCARNCTRGIWQMLAVIWAHLH
jgi:hypothetical protein